MSHKLAFDKNLLNEYEIGGSALNNNLIFSYIAGYTDVGLVRTNNEDAFIMADLSVGRTLPEAVHISHKLGENSILLVVSDGVGGSSGGEIASELTVLAIKDALMRLPRNISAYDRLVAAVEDANHLVWNERASSQLLKNMAATVTAVLIEGNEVYVAEVGDSRAYLIRKNNIKQVTTDQSFVNYLVQQGVIKPEQAARHPRKNVILQSIGSNEAVKVAVSMFQLRAEDTLMLCTDGLSNNVRADEICQICKTSNPENACWQLIQIAKERGGQDNITLILAKFDGDALNLNQDTSVGGLTAALKPLSVFNPDEEVEKSHKRTQLLGSSSIVNMFYGSGDFQQIPALTPTNTLSDFPNASIIKHECRMLVEYLDYCEQILSLQPDQTQQAADWLESNGMCYTKLKELMTELQDSLENVIKAKQAVSRFWSEWEKPND